MTFVRKSADLSPIKDTVFAVAALAAKDKQENGDKRHRFKDKRSDRNIRILLKPLIEPFHFNGVQNDREAQNDEQHPVCSHTGNEEYAKSYRCIGNKCSDQV